LLCPLFHSHEDSTTSFMTYEANFITCQFYHVSNGYDYLSGDWREQHLHLAKTPLCKGASFFRGMAQNTRVALTCHGSLSKNLTLLIQCLAITWQVEQMAFESCSTLISRSEVSIHSAFVKKGWLQSQSLFIGSVPDGPLSTEVSIRL
jgi:hypothetical protein